jgi:hypothetical protein
MTAKVKNYWIEEENLGLSHLVIFLFLFEKIKMLNCLNTVSIFIFHKKNSATYSKWVENCLKLPNWLYRTNVNFAYILFNFCMFLALISCHLRKKNLSTNDRTEADTNTNINSKLTDVVVKQFQSVNLSSNLQSY